MTTQLTLTLGEVLKVMRDRAKLTQRQLGERLELSRNTVNRYEQDLFVPRWRDVEAWALECEHSPDIARPAWEEARRSGWIYGADPPQPALFERDDRGRWLLAS